jgi:hypothetical protein
METHWINLGHFGLTSESWGYDLKKTKWELKSRINLMLKNKIDDRKPNLKRKPK